MAGVLLVVLVFGFVVISGLAVVIAIALLARDERSRKRALADKPRILDGTFTADNVVVKVDAGTLPYEDYVIGANERGYRMLSETAEPGNRKTVIFVRA